MDNRDLNDERWVDECLLALDPVSGWTPDPERAHARLLGKQRLRTKIHRASFCAVAACVIGVLTLLALPAPARCAMTGLGCSRGSVPVAPALATATASKSAVAVNYKQQGSPAAPVVCEIYSDYECPACAAFYLEVFPQLESNYVRSGKLRIVHRDFPLPMHRYALAAARYADAAGELGYYPAVFRQLFAAQKDWSINGDLDRVVAAILPPEKMMDLRKRLATGAAIDSGLAADMEMVRRDQITQTPTLVFVAKDGVRTKVAGNQPYSLLARFLDEMLKR
jgi:protein-disulfide isomerase